MVELWRRGKQMVQDGRVIADGTGIVVVFDHHVDALAPCSLDESRYAGAGGIDELAVGILWQEPRQEQQSRVLAVVHEVEHLAGHLRLFALDEVDLFGILLTYSYL